MRFVRNKTNICSVYNFLRGNTALHLVLTKKSEINLNDKT